jgi:hypothetical protein
MKANATSIAISRSDRRAAERRASHRRTRARA